MKNSLQRLSRIFMNRTLNPNSDVFIFTWTVKAEKTVASVRDGSIDVEMLSEVKKLRMKISCFAKVDHTDICRQGVPEVIFASGKTVLNQVLSIARVMHKKKRLLSHNKGSKKIFNASV